MRVPVTVVAALFAVLGLSRVASPVPGFPTGALDAELASRALTLEGDDSPGADRRMRAVARAIRSLERDGLSAARRLRTLRAVVRILGRAFGEDPVLEALLSQEVDGIATRLSAERDALDRYLGDLADSPERDAGRAALARADARWEGLDEEVGIAARSHHLARVSLALGCGWRASGSLGGWLTMEVNGGDFVSDWFEATAVPSGPDGTWRLEVTATRGRTTGAGFQISFVLEGVTRPGGFLLHRPGEAVFRDYSHGVATGEEYTTRGGTFGGGSVVLTTFDPEGGIVEGTFGMTVSRYEDFTLSFFNLAGGEFRGALRVR